MNSEAAGTEYQVTITEDGRVKLIESDGGKGVTVKRTIGEWTPGELAEVIARNVQPSTDWIEAATKEIWERSASIGNWEIREILTRHANAPQCALTPNWEKLLLIKFPSFDPSWSPEISEKWHRIFNELRNLGEVELEARPVPQPATEPTKKKWAYTKQRSGLKKCPFCGTAAIEQGRLADNQTDMHYRILCGNPYCTIECATNVCAALKDAENFWQDRSLVQAETEKP